MENIVLYNKINSLPVKMKEEVLDFVEFLLAKNKQPKKGKNEKVKVPVFGSGKGLFEMQPDFDEPLEDFKDYMY
jgi:hypothetical protein